MGGSPAESPKDVADKSDVIITSLPSIDAFQSVMTGADSIKDANKDGLIVIECSTLPIKEKQSAHDVLADTGKILLDCPISGTGAQAANKDLSIYVSGDQKASEKCHDIFNGFANLNFYVGEFGNGSKMKFVANHLVHIHNVASAEAMVLGMKSGLDPHLIFDVISTSAATSRMFQVRGKMMADANYDDVGMSNRLYQKDLDIITSFASDVHCPVNLFAASVQPYRATIDQGLAEKDTAAVCAVLEDQGRVKR